MMTTRIHRFSSGVLADILFSDEEELKTMLHTLGKGTEDRGIDLKVWVSGILHTNTAHTNT